MSINYSKFIPQASVIAGILIGAFLVNPTVHAGAATILVPAESADVPEGSQIPERRVEKVERMVKEYKEKMEARTREQQQQAQPQGNGG